jgi:DNA adenine methylase
MGGTQFSTGIVREKPRELNIAEGVCCGEAVGNVRLFAGCRGKTGETYVIWRICRSPLNFDVKYFGDRMPPIQESLLIADEFTCRGNQYTSMATQPAFLRKSHVINVASVPHRSPFRYPGGKTWLVPRIRQWLKSLKPRPQELAEPFAGGAIVGLTSLFEGLADRLVLVEKDQDVSSVWDVLINGEARKLGDAIVNFDFSADAVREVLASNPTTVFDRAFVTILRNRVQRGGILAAGASLIKKGENGKGMASRWYPVTLRNRIEAIFRTRRNMSFILGDGIEFIRYNSHRSETAFFIDPPYTVAGRRLYTHSDIDHEALFDLASRIRGDFLMTYDNAEEIRRLAAKFGFQTELVAMKNTHHEIMNELLVGRNLDWLR